MMEKIRTAANSIIVKIIFGIIILAFIFTGVGGFLGMGSNANDEQQYIAKVDGEGLSRNAFEKEAQYATQNAGTLGGDDSLQRMIRRSVLSNQIDNYLSYKFSESLNTKISDEQVKKVIRQQSVFFEKGSFSNKLYLELLAANHYTPDAYANGLRSAIMQEQVMNALFLSDFVISKDSDISFLENQTRTIYLADYTISNINNDKFTITDDEIKNYYDENQQEFHHEKRLKMKFITNFLPAIEKYTQISNNEIEKYYSDGKDGSMSPEKHLYSVLSFDNLNAAEQEYQKIIKDKVQLSTKMDRLGWFSVNETLPEILVKADLKNVNDISKPIEEDGSFYLIRLDQIEKSEKLPFEYAKRFIRDLLYQEKVDKQYQDLQFKLEKASKLSTMEEIAKESGLALHESDWTFEKESFSIGRFSKINAIAFSDEMVKNGEPTGKISDIIHIDEYVGSYIIQVTDYEDAGISSFEEVKETIKEKLLAEKKKAIFSQQLETTLAQLKQSGSAEGVSFSQRISVTRDLVDERINENTVKEVFSLVPSVNGYSYGLNVLDDEKAQFFVLTDVKYPEQVEDLSEKLKPESIRLIQHYLANDLRSKAKIEIMPNANL